MVIFEKSQSWNGHFENGRFWNGDFRNGHFWNGHSLKRINSELVIFEMVTSKNGQSLKMVISDLVMFEMFISEMVMFEMIIVEMVIFKQGMTQLSKPANDSRSGLASFHCIRCMFEMFIVDQRGMAYWIGIKQKTCCWLLMFNSS